MAYVIGDDCVACGTCIDECPVGAISEGEKYVIDADACTECGTCADVCPRVQFLSKYKGDHIIFKS
ncbi:4Fe-4S dicluster domain-containing protein [Paraprevotella clara]|nr:4Fe-4S dicluster domain-containing protein [Paraprevotella clara]